MIVIIPIHELTNILDEEIYLVQHTNQFSILRGKKGIDHKFPSTRVFIGSISPVERLVVPCVA